MSEQPTKDQIVKQLRHSVRTATECDNTIAAMPLSFARAAADEIERLTAKEETKLDVDAVVQNLEPLLDLKNQSWTKACKQVLALISGEHPRD